MIKIIITIMTKVCMTPLKWSGEERHVETRRRREAARKTRSQEGRASKVISRMECKYFMNPGMGLTEKSVPGNSIDRPARAKVRFFS